MFSPHQHQNNSNRNLSSTNREEEEEEDGLECLSFRNFAGDSCVHSNYRPYSDGDLEFEFLPLVIPDNTALSQISFYPLFGVDEHQRQAKMKVMDFSLHNTEKDKNSDQSISEFVAKISFLPSPPPMAMGAKRRSRLDKRKSSSAPGRPLSRWRRLIKLLIGKKTTCPKNERLYITRNKSTMTTPTNTIKKIPKDDRKRLTYLPYRSNLMAMFPVNTNI